MIFIPHTQLSIPRDTSQTIVAGPKTFRRASRKVLSNKRKGLPYSNFGGNRQNIEKKMRIIWEADPGYELINIDQEGADAKIVAYLCRHAQYRELFIQGIKPHLYLALVLFPQVWLECYDKDKVREALKTPIPGLKHLPFWKELSALIKSSDDWEPRKRVYYFGKKVGHAGNYGMHENKLIMVILEETQGEIVLDKAEGGRWLLMYHNSLFPEIQSDFQFRVAKQAKDKKQLRNLLGFPFNITSEVRDRDMNDLFAWIPQSSVAGINERAYIGMQDYIESNDKDWHLLQETHDSITGQTPIGQGEEYAHVLRGLYEQIKMKSPIDNVEFNMTVGIQKGLNWYSYDKDKNSEGLQDIKL